MSNYRPKSDWGAPSSSESYYPERGELLALRRTVEKQLNIIKELEEFKAQQKERWRQQRDDMERWKANESILANLKAENRIKDEIELRTRVEEDKEMYRKAVHDLRSEVSTLKDSLEECESVKKHLEKTIMKERHDRSKIESSLCSLKKQMGEIESETVKKEGDEEHARQLELLLEQERQRVQYFQQENSHLTQVVQELSQRNEEGNRAWHAAMAKADEQMKVDEENTEKISELSSTVSMLEQVNSEQRAELDRVKEARAEADIKRKMAEEELELASIKLKALRSTYDNLQTESQHNELEWSEEIATIKQELDKSKKANRKLAAQIEELKSKPKITLVDKATTTMSPYPGVIDISDDESDTDETIKDSTEIERVYLESLLKAKEENVKLLEEVETLKAKKPVVDKEVNVVPSELEGPAVENTVDTTKKKDRRSSDGGSNTSSQYVDESGTSRVCSPTVGAGAISVPTISSSIQEPCSSKDLPIDAEVTSPSTSTSSASSAQGATPVGSMMQELAEFAHRCFHQSNQLKEEFKRKCEELSTAKKDVDDLSTLLRAQADRAEKGATEVDMVQMNINLKLTICQLREQFGRELMAQRNVIQSLTQRLQNMSGTVQDGEGASKMSTSTENPMSSISEVNSCSKSAESSNENVDEESLLPPPPPPPSLSPELEEPTPPTQSESGSSLTLEAPTQSGKSTPTPPLPPPPSPSLTPAPGPEEVPAPTQTETNPVIRRFLKRPLKLGSESSSVTVSFKNPRKLPTSSTVEISTTPVTTPSPAPIVVQKPQTLPQAQAQNMPRLAAQTSLEKPCGIPNCAHPFHALGLPSHALNPPLITVSRSPIPIPVQSTGPGPYRNGTSTGTSIASLHTSSSGVRVSQTGANRPHSMAFPFPYMIHVPPPGGIPESANNLQQPPQDIRAPTMTAAMGRPPQNGQPATPLLVKRVKQEDEDKDREQKPLIDREKSCYKLLPVDKDKVKVEAEDN